jgi:hypothetical protein
LFEGELRIAELGEAAADHVHLRLHFPAGFDLDEDPPEVGAPPERPTFNRFGGVGFRGPIGLEKLVARPGSIRLPGTDKPKNSTEGGLTKVDYDLGRLNQSDHRDVPPFRLRAAAPGNYEVEWEATASGLNKPSRGTLLLSVGEPNQGVAIQSLEDADAERDAYDFL